MAVAETWRRTIASATVIVCLSFAGCDDTGKKAPANTSTPTSTNATNNAPAPASTEPIELLNVSYDPTRELWTALNEQFLADWEKKSKQPVTIKMSHAGSSAQARSVIDGNDADVVTLAMWTDTNAIAKAGLIKENWDERLPNGSLPYSSTIVFVVRKGNPKGIKDWPDLVKDGVEIITPNPKTSGNGKLSLLSAWGAIVLRDGTVEEATEYLKKLYSQVPVLDTGARGSTTTFAQKGIGDVHLTWENEAHREVQDSKGELELVYPKISIRAEPRVAIVDANVDRKGSRAVAQAYLDYLYTDEAQKTIAENHYRPFKPEVLSAYAKSFPPIELFSVKKIAANWQEADDKFFGEGGVFDSVFGDKAK